MTFKMQIVLFNHRYGHTIKFTPHPIPNCEVKLDGPVQYWGGGPLGKFVVLYRPLLSFNRRVCSTYGRPLVVRPCSEFIQVWLDLSTYLYLQKEVPQEVW